MILYNILYLETELEPFSLRNICILANQSNDSMLALAGHVKLISHFDDFIPFLKAQIQKFWEMKSNYII